MKVVSVSILGIFKLWTRDRIEVEDGLQRLGNVVRAVKIRGEACHPHFRPPSARLSSGSSESVGASPLPCSDRDLVNGPRPSPVSSQRGVWL